MSFKITITFLTPCFLGGAEPASHSEFRLASLKGLLRYWWRQFQDQSNTQALFNKESEIFGSREKGSGFFLYELDRSGLCFERSENGYTQRSGGKSYLFFSCIPRGPNQPGRKNWIKEGSSISFAICFVKLDDNQIKQILLSLWLLQTFGGLGSRSRRGAGSFQVKEADVQGDREDIKTWVQNLFNSQASDLVDVININGCNKDNRFQFIAGNSPIYVNLKQQNHFHQFRPTHPISCADEILEMLGQRMRTFRSCFTFNNRSNLLPHIQAAALHKAGKTNIYEGPNPIEKTAFGLPIIFNFKKRDLDGTLDRGNQKFEDWRIILRPKSYERRASPLFISIKKDPKQNNYYANLLILWGSFLPQNEGIAIIRRRRGDNNEETLGNLAIPTAKALEKFLEFLRQGNLQ